MTIEYFSGIPVDLGDNKITKRNAYARQVIERLAGLVKTLRSGRIEVVDLKTYKIHMSGGLHNGGYTVLLTTNAEKLGDKSAFKVKVSADLDLGFESKIPIEGPKGAFMLSDKPSQVAATLRGKYLSGIESATKKLRHNAEHYESDSADYQQRIEQMIGAADRNSVIWTSDDQPNLDSDHMFHFDVGNDQGTLSAMASRDENDLHVCVRMTFDEMLAVRNLLLDSRKVAA